jgi:hypothetical protein
MRLFHGQSRPLKASRNIPPRRLQSVDYLRQMID